MVVGAGFKEFHSIAPANNSYQYKYDFLLPTTEVVTNTVVETNNTRIFGAFWLEWIRETNTTPTRVCMEGFDSFSQTFFTNCWTGFTTNYMWGSIILTNGFWDPYSRPCEKEHFDTSEKTEVLYIQSNLVSFLVWRGITNRHYLESIPVTNIVHKWHFEKKKVQTQ